MLLVLAIACKKTNNGNTSSQDVFPNKIGDQWHYLVRDTTIQGNQDSGSIQYNLDVTIVGTVKWPSGIIAAIWQFKYPDRTDTNFVFQSGDTIRFMDKTNTYFVRQYIIPFALGSSWRYTFGFENVAVTGQGNIMVENNSYADAWEVYGDAGVPDGIFRVDEWFESHVGLVRKYFNPFGELLYTRHILDWSLVSYELR